MGIPIQRGRDFEASDTAKSNPVIIISESMAREMYPEGDALGKRIRSWRDENLYREIVGIAGNTRYYNLTDKPANAVYVPHTQDPWRSLVLAVRTRVDPFALMPAIKRNIRASDPKLVISEVRTMDQVMGRAIESSRFTAFLLGLFAVLALTLAAVGIYGVTSYVVAQRTREFGIRIALGARTRHVLGGVLGQCAALIAAGTLLGVAGATALTRTLTSLLCGVSPRDPATFGFAAGILCAIALAACALPAWRATRVQPSETLRCE
jgi:putative ABC transport system permease protein